MGLDMYLEVNSHSVAKAGWEGIGDDWYQKYGYCAYWRKANAIHDWFVRNVQNGVDDCGSYEVDVESLMQLLDTVNEVLDSTKLVDGVVTNGYKMGEGGLVPIRQSGKVLEDDSVARTLLPTKEGFFFGGTEYDQWYWEDLNYTSKALKNVLGAIGQRNVLLFGEYAPLTWTPNDDPDFEVRFRYSASW